MSFISGLGKPEYSIPTPVQKSGNSTDDFLSLTDSTAQSSTAVQNVASNQSSATSQQSEQDREEAFAKMMVQLQNPTVAQTDAMNNSDGSSDSLAAIAGASGVGGASGSDSSSSAITDFQNYMQMTPAEKMRYAAMSSLGVTPESYANMSPEDKAKVDAKIADIMKKQQEMQAGASGTAAPTTTAAADSSGAGSSTDSQQPSFLNKALASLTQSATDAASKLDVA
ncbi:MAG: hypothetical protein JWQ69_774 [Pseudomonas sp.]|nr:hypothetical protein [Pseudomonas sp.]